MGWGTVAQVQLGQSCICFPPRTASSRCHFELVALLTLLLFSGQAYVFVLPVAPSLLLLHPLHPQPLLSPQLLVLRATSARPRRRSVCLL